MLDPGGSAGGGDEDGDRLSVSSWAAHTRRGSRGRSECHSVADSVDVEEGEAPVQRVLPSMTEGSEDSNE
jgi:hypothetical protein